jgi:hypothetical protein
MVEIENEASILSMIYIILSERYGTDLFACLRHIALQFQGHLVTQQVVLTDTLLTTKFIHSRMMDVHTMAHFFFLDAKFLWIISVTISNLQQCQICGSDQLKHDDRCLKDELIPHTSTIVVL